VIVIERATKSLRHDRLTTTVTFNNLNVVYHSSIGPTDSVVGKGTSCACGPGPVCPDLAFSSQIFVVVFSNFKMSFKIVKLQT